MFVDLVDANDSSSDECGDSTPPILHPVRPTSTMAAVELFGDGTCDRRKRAHRAELYLRASLMKEPLAIIALIDDGSDVSFLRKSVADTLRLNLRPSAKKVSLLDGHPIKALQECEVYVSAERLEEAVSISVMILEDSTMKGLNSMNAGLLLGKDQLYNLGRIVLDSPMKSLLILGEKARQRSMDPDLTRLLGGEFYSAGDNFCLVNKSEDSDAGHVNIDNSQYCMFASSVSIPTLTAMEVKKEGSLLDITQAEEPVLDESAIGDCIKKALTDMGCLDDCYPVPNALGYFMRIVEVKGTDVHRDTLQQDYCFEIDIPDRIPSEKDAHTLTEKDASLPFDFSPAVLRRLTKEQRALFDEQIQDNIDKKFWKKICADEIPRTELPYVATVFPVIAKETKTTKVRPVVDCRPLNSKLAPSFSKRLDWRTPLLRLRLLAMTKGVNSIDVLDLRKAYYSIHCRSPLFCRIAEQFYRVDRVLFGVAFGPSALQCAMDLFLMIVKRVYLYMTKNDSASIVDLLEDYFDDLILVASEILFVTILKKVGLVFGFMFKHERLQTGGRTNLFGTDIQLERDGLKIFCPIPEIASELVNCKVLTKRQLYKLAGKMSIDRTLTHAPIRGLSDILRSLASGPWDEICNSTAIDSVLEQCKMYISQLTCSNGHLCIPASTSEGNKLEIVTDASKECCAYQVTCNNQVLMNHISICKKSAKSDHSNDKELLATHKGVKKLLSVLEKSRKFRFDELIIASDNKATANWANPGSRLPDAGSLTTTRRALQIREYVSALSKHCKLVTVKHIPGKMNSVADHLSRVLNPILNTFTEIAPNAQSDSDTNSDGHAFIAVSAATIADSSPTVRVFHDCFRLDQYLRRIRSIIKIQRRYHRFVREKTANPALHSLFEFAQVGLEMTDKTISKANAFKVGALWISHDRNAVIMRPNCFVTTLIVEDTHREGHVMFDTLLYRSRSKIWAPDLRQVVTNVIKACTFCKVKHAKHTKPSYRPGIHECDKTTFETIGIDYFRFGRVFNDSGQLVKAHVFLIVDKLSRFIFLRTYTAQTLTNAQNALLEFISIFGKPNKIRGDQAFEGLGAFASNHGINLVTNRSGYNPTYSGFVESLVKISKRFIECALHEVSPGRYPTLGQLQATVMSANFLVNQRPLTIRMNAIVTPHQVVFGKITSFAESLLSKSDETDSPVTSAEVSNFMEQSIPIRIFMLAVDDHLFEHTRSSLVSTLNSQLPTDFTIGELLLFKTGIRFRIVEVASAPSIQYHELRSGIRKLYEVKDVATGRLHHADRAVLRRLEV